MTSRVNTSILKDYFFFSTTQGKVQQVLSVIEPFLPIGAESFNEISPHFFNINHPLIKPLFVSSSQICA